MYKPLVSVYMPAYNCEKYIKQAIDSVLDQTYDNIEICICNDGSTDNTTSVLEDNYTTEERVSWISQENKGIGTASNVAVSMCKGEIIAQLDSDDWLESEAIERVIKVYSENPKIGGVYTDYNFTNENGDFIRAGYSFPQFNQNIMLKMNIVHPLRTFKKEVWDKTEGFDENLKNAVDYDIQLKLTEKCKYYHLRERLYNYRQHKNSTTHKENMEQASNSVIAINNALTRRKLPIIARQKEPGSFVIILERKDSGNSSI